MRSRSVSQAGTLAAIIVVAAAIRLFRLGAPSLWTDEGWSATIATMPRAAMWHIVATRETNRGLYYVFLHLWIALLGSSEAALRLPSALASIATIPLLYAAGRRMFGMRAGLVAALLFALSPVSVFFARDATAYALEIMFATAGLLLLLRVLEGASFGKLAGWAVCEAFAVLSHSLAIAAVPAQLLPLALLNRRDVPWVRLLTTAALLIAGLAPLLWLISRNDHGQLNWIRPLSWPVVGEAIFGIAGGMTDDPSGQAVVAAYGLGILLGFAATIRAWDRSPTEAFPFALAASGVVLPFLLALGISFIKPILYYRYLIFSLPCLCLFVAGGVAAIRTRAIAALGLAALITGSTWHSWFMLERFSRYDWRQPAAYIMSHARPGDMLAVRYGPNRMLLEYYLARAQMPRGLVESVFPDWGPDLLIDGKYFLDAEAQEFMAKRLLAQIDSTAARGRRLWFVVGGEGMGTPFDRTASLSLITRRLYADYKSVQIHWVDNYSLTIIECSEPRATPAHPPKTPIEPR